MNRLMKLLHALMGVLVVAVVSVPLTAQAADDDVVFLWGTTTERENMFAQSPGGMAVTDRNLNLSAVCRGVYQILSQNIPNDVLTTIYDESDQDDIPGPDEGTAPRGLEECGMGEYDFDPTDGQSDVWLIYSSCAMIMGNGTSIMRWTVPPLASEAEMTIIDVADGSGFRMKLETALNNVGAVTDDAAMGNLRDYSIRGPAGSDSFTLRVNGRERDYQAGRYDYSYMGDIGAQGTNGGMIFQSGRIDSEGEAWIVDDLPGADVVSLFYQNFADNVRPAAGMGTMIDGMIKQMAGLTRHGIPVKTKQRITVIGGSMQGFMNGVNTAPAGTGMISESESTIDRIAVYPGIAPQTCGATVVPADIEMTNMNDLMAGGVDGTGGMGSVADVMASPEYQEAMAEMAKQMENMTPEEKAMMEQFGLGSMMGGVATAANSGADASSAGANAITEGSGSASPGNPNAGTAKVSSAELTTDDLLESVQKHLAALGYNPGNTDGTTSVMTEVAVSQFQAENKMAVTGKVTPQLLGILSAKVDSQ